jgi:hypothetical protein
MVAALLITMDVLAMFMSMAIRVTWAYVTEAYAKGISLLTAQPG